MKPNETIENVTRLNLVSNYLLVISLVAFHDGFHDFKLQMLTIFFFIWRARKIEKKLYSDNTLNATNSFNADSE